MSANNGQAVILGRELRLRISPQHVTSLQALAKRHGHASPTALAELLLAEGIERAARNSVYQHILGVVMSAWQCARWE